ncbi:MAG TPA: hypothetical protein VHQ86_03565, partial [Candidatus Saccharimonadia bacterium]|nr:hypothetical protein [Candidatus Saccharimonadia bacterium]
MTPRLKQFTLFGVLLNIPYLGLLWLLLSRHSIDTASIGAVVIVYVVLLTSIEGYFKCFDPQRSVRYNLSLRYSLIALLLATPGIALWGLQIHNPILFFLAEAAAVVAILGASFVASRRTIKGT